VRKTNFEIWFKKPELETTLFILTSLTTAVISNYFLMTLLALFIFLYLTNAGILGMMGLKKLSFSKARTLLRVTLTSSTDS
jgi:hypothetical protein